MLIFWTIVHVVLAVFMIFVILLQPGKDAGMGAALGGGAATSAFGGRGAVTFLSKLTAACAGLFFLTSLGLSFVGMGSSVAAVVPAQESVVPPAPKAVEQAPADPGAQGVQAADPAGQDAPLPLDVPPAEPAQELGDNPVPGTTPAPPAGGAAPPSPAPAPAQ